MTLTIEEYSALLYMHSTITNKIYWKGQKKPKYQKWITRILGMEGEEIKGNVKGESCGIPWKVLKPHVVGANNNEQTMKMFALAIYGLVIFPKVLGHIEMTVVDFFEKVDNKKINPILSIMVETIRTLKFSRTERKWHLVTCTQLFYIWIQNHFLGKQKVHIFPYTYIPISEFHKVEWSESVTKDQ
ncbi:hypothetical protein REPUB_Repub04eG0100000 [Reevesia pubescens]